MMYKKAVSNSRLFYFENPCYSDFRLKKVIKLCLCEE